MWFRKKDKTPKHYHIWEYGFDNFELSNGSKMDIEFRYCPYCKTIEKRIFLGNLNNTFDKLYEQVKIKDEESSFEYKVVEKDTEQYTLLLRFFEGDLKHRISEANDTYKFIEEQREKEKTMCKVCRKGKIEGDRFVWAYPPMIMDRRYCTNPDCETNKKY